MNLLLDTHVAIWFITDAKELPTKTKKIIENTEHNYYVSIASFWEIGIKYALNRLELGLALDKIFALIQETGFELLAITPEHILQNAQLKWHHKDPFDRIIMAQAISENLKLISKDAYFDSYEVDLLWEK